MALGSSSNALDLSILRACTTLKPSTILDIGCGQGKIGALCMGHIPGCKITGLQRLFHSDDLASLTQIGYSHVIDTDINEYMRDGFDEVYDLVTICDVIEHFFYSDAISILKFLAYRADWILIVWPSKHPQNAVSHIFDRHRFSMEPRELFHHFDVVRYEQTGFSAISAVHTYHMALLRGDMNLKNAPRF